MRCISQDAFEDIEAAREVVAGGGERRKEAQRVPHGESVVYREQGVFAVVVRARDDVRHRLDRPEKTTAPASAGDAGARFRESARSVFRPPRSAREPARFERAELPDALEIEEAFVRHRGRIA
jgi:hypothetical protein